MCLHHYTVLVCFRGGEASLEVAFVANKAMDEARLRSKKCAWVALYFLCIEGLILY